MPKAYIEKVGEEEFRKKPIGSGPWKFVRNVPGDRIEFTAVDYPHWRGTPHFKELHDPAGAGGEHAGRDGAHRRGGDRLDRAGDDAGRRARRARSPVGARHDAGGFPVLGRLPAGSEGQPDRQAARAAGAVAGDRPQAGDRARDERQGEHALSLRHLRLHRIFQRRTLEEVGGEGVPLRSGSGEEDAGRGGLSQRVRAEVRQHGAAGHAVHGRYRHRDRRHVDQDRHQGEHQALRMGRPSRRWSAATRRDWLESLDVPHRRPARRALALRGRLLARERAAPAGRQGPIAMRPARNS